LSFAVDENTVFCILLSHLFSLLDRIVNGH
jgi:hypothetical protein